MPNPPPLAVNQFTTMPQPFEEDLSLYRRLGVEEIELCEQKLDRDEERARDQLAQLRDSGLQVCSVQPRVHSIFPDRLAPEPADPRDRLAMFRRTIDSVADAMPDLHVPFVLIGGAAPDGDVRTAWETTLNLVPELAEYAADRGLSLTVEPIHPLLMNKDTFIWRLDQAVDLLESLGCDNCGLTVDVWHVWQEPDVVSHLRGLADRVNLVHLSDWWRGGPRHFDDRGIPGRGIINLPAILNALHEAGYRGPWVLEVLSDERLDDSLWRADPAEVIKASRGGFEKAWRDAVGAGAEV